MKAAYSPGAAGVSHCDSHAVSIAAALSGNMHSNSYKSGRPSGALAELLKLAVLEVERYR